MQTTWNVLRTAQEQYLLATQSQIDTTHAKIRPIQHPPYKNVNNKSTLIYIYIKMLPLSTKILAKSPQQEPTTLTFVHKITAVEPPNVRTESMLVLMVPD